MLEGVIVLNTINIEAVPLPLIIVLVIGIILCIALIVAGFYVGDPIWFLGFLGAAVFVGLLIVSLRAGPETRYEVTVSDSVSVTEFTSKYEILEQRGNIYTIRERPTE